MNSPLKLRDEIAYINGKDEDAVLRISETIKDYMAEQTEEIIVLCIGSDRVTGDSLGPITGYKLKDKIPAHENIKILGCLDSPVHAKNLAGTIEQIKREWHNPYIIAVDACLGRASHIGYVTVGKGALTPGAGVNKKLPEIGDIFITGIVNVSSPRDLSIIQTTRLGVVMNMAEIISKGISRALGIN